MPTLPGLVFLSAVTLLVACGGRGPIGGGSTGAGGLTGSGGSVGSGA